MHTFLLLNTVKHSLVIVFNACLTIIHLTLTCLAASANGRSVPETQGAAFSVNGYTRYKDSSQCFFWQNLVIPKKRVPWSSGLNQSETQRIRTVLLCACRHRQPDVSAHL